MVVLPSDGGSLVQTCTVRGHSDPTEGLEIWQKRTDGLSGPVEGVVNPG